MVWSGFLGSGQGWQVALPGKSPLLQSPTHGIAPVYFDKKCSQCLALSWSHQGSQ